MIFKLLRIFTVIVSFFFLTGFVSVFSILGPGVTAITSGNLYKAGAQFIINQRIEKETGKNSLVLIKEELNKSDLDIKNLNFSDIKDIPDIFIDKKKLAFSENIIKKVFKPNTFSRSMI